MQRFDSSEFKATVNKKNHTHTLTHTHTHTHTHIRTQNM